MTTTTEEAIELRTTFTGDGFSYKRGGSFEVVIVPSLHTSSRTPEKEEAEVWNRLASLVARSKQELRR
jgi:hypothetical protein